jgi:hypothetical protein
VRLQDFSEVQMPLRTTVSCLTSFLVSKVRLQDLCEFPTPRTELLNNGHPSCLTGEAVGLLKSSPHPQDYSK